MLNYETILSNYDDKLTLMQWLKKVEAALENASATAFHVNNRGNATLTFSIDFADGSQIESGPIILQEGESVESARISNGHLVLTLTNGDELDAGDLGGVSSFAINSSQHLIVTYQSGRTQDLGAIFQGNISISGNLSVSGNITQDGIGYASMGFTAVPASGVSRTAIYCRAISLPHLLLIVINEQIEITNSGYVQNMQYNCTLPANIAEKVIDLSGQPATATPEMNAIAHSQGLLRTSLSGWEPDALVTQMMFYNIAAANRVNVYYRLPSGLAVGTKRYFTGRLFIVL